MSGSNGALQHLTEKKPLLSAKKVSVSRPLFASFIASIMSFASGTVVGGWTPPENPKTLGEHLFSSENIEKSSLVVSIYVVGAFVGALPAGQFSKSIGRKRFLLLLAIPMCLGWLMIMLFADEVHLIYVGRMLCGLSLGAVTVAVPLYSCDVAPTVCRGRSGVFLDFMLCAGILYAYAASSVAGLRVFAFTCSLIPVAFGALFAFMPESPQHLYAEGRYVDAKAALTWLYGKDFDVKQEFDKFSRLQNEDDYESSADEYPLNDNSCKDQDKRRAFRKAVVLSVALATIQRMSGAGAIVQFTAKLFAISGSSVQPITASIITGVTQLVGSAVAVVLVDRAGRRKLLLISSAAVVCCLFLLALYFYYLIRGTLDESLKILPIFIVCAHISFFRVGLGPIPWFMTAELLGDDHENRAQSYVASYSWILSFAVMQSFIPLVNNWPVALWFGYGSVSALGLLFVLFFVPETNDKSDQEIRLSLMRTSQLFKAE